MDAIKIYIEPNFSVPDRAEGGIRRVVEAQFKYLPEFGITPLKEERMANITAGHGMKQCLKHGAPFVSHCHGLLWSDYAWERWHYEVNESVVEAMTKAQAVTAPSIWVAQAISRGLLVAPEVIYHGVDADEWLPEKSGHSNYVFWNKARHDPVSDSSHLQILARHMPAQQFVSTLGVEDPNVKVVGVQPVGELRPILQDAGIYLATARETFGIGTLEALAAGVPVAGWDYGGQAEIIIPGETGYLAPFENWEALAECVNRCLAERDRLSANCIADARTRWAWPDKIAQYATIYRRVYADWYTARPKVSIIVPCHNLGRFLTECLSSVKAQSLADWECLIVDDASTDNTKDVALSFADYDGRFKYLPTPKNLKLVGALNFGASHARGRYCLNLDADNLLGDGALEILARELDEKPSVHIVYGMLDVVNEAGQERRRNGFPTSEPFDWRKQMAHLNQIPSSAMYRHEVWERSGGWRERCWRAEDAEFWCRVTSLGFRAERATDETTLIYRMRSDSKSQGEPGDGDWTAWYPWRLGATSGAEGMAIIREHPKGVPVPELVPFGAQMKRDEKEKNFWEVWHRQTPLVSIIIPVGPGHERLVLDALDSLVAQDIDTWEAVVVNNTGHEMQSIPGAPYARIVTSPAKQVGAARNAGVKAARGKFIYFLDADDFLLPGGLRAMLERYLQQDCSYVYSDYVQVGEDWKEKLVVMPDFQQGEWRAQHSINILIAKADFQKVGGFDAELPGWEDWELFVKLAVNGLCGARVPLPTWAYRFHTGTRRDDSLSKEEILLPLLRGRYSKFYDGGAEMSRCCGGNADALLSAQKIVRMLNPEYQASPVDATGAPDAPPMEIPPVVRMKFIGEQVGAITFFGKDGRQYRGGNNNLERYTDVARADLERMINSGYWEIVPLPAPEKPIVAPPPPPPPAAPPPPPAPTPEPLDLGPNTFRPETMEAVAVAPAPEPAALKTVAEIAVKETLPEVVKAKLPAVKPAEKKVEKPNGHKPGDIVPTRRRPGRPRK